MQELSPEAESSVMAGAKMFSPFDYQTAATMDHEKLEILQEFHAGGRKRRKPDTSERGSLSSRKGIHSSYLAGETGIGSMMMGSATP